MADQNVNLTVTQSGGITHAILNKLHEDGFVAQGKNLSGSVWTQIMVEVENDASGQYTGGSTFIEGQSSDAKASWASNFKVKAGQVLEFTQTLWNKIVAIVKGEPIKQEESIPQTTPQIIPKGTEPIDESEYMSDQSLDEVIISPEFQRPEEGTKPVVDNSVPQEEPQQTVHEFKPIPDGAKQMLRDIINIDSNTKGNKETVVMTKNDDGTKVYNQVVTDPKTGSSVMGGRLIADNKSGKNEFYAVDETIPDGAEVDKKTVDGNKETLNYEIKEEDGKTHRYLMEQDNETGKYQKGAEIFSIKSSSTNEDTNKFVSETELNKKLQEMNVGKNVQELQQLGIEVQQYDNGSVVFKKDGKVLSGTDLKVLLNADNAQPVGQTPVISQGENGGILLQAQVDKAPVIDHPPVYYDGASGSVSPVPQGDDKSIQTDPVNVDGAEAPDKKTPSKLTQEQINEKIAHLKNGESFSYRNTIDQTYANGSFHMERTITWQRNDDGSLTCNSPDYRGKPSITHYNNDGTVKLDSTTYEQFLGTSNYIKTSTVYKEGKISTKTQDLSGLGDIRSAHTVPSMLRTHMSRQQGAQDVSIKDSEGNNILSYKDGKFYNKKGKEVDSSKAYDILAKYEKRGELSKLVANYEKVEQSENTTPNAPVDNNQSIEITDEIRTRMKNISTAALASDFKYEFDESGQLKTSGTVSLINDYKNSGAETIGLMVRSLPTYYNQNTKLFTKFGVQSRRQSIVNTGADNKAMTLIQHQAIYNDLSTKPKSELTDAQKNFMKKHEQDMAKLFQEYDAAKQNK